MPRSTLNRLSSGTGADVAAGLPAEHENTEVIAIAPAYNSHRAFEFDFIVFILISFQKKIFLHEVFGTQVESGNPAIFCVLPLHRTYVHVFLISVNAFNVL
jgi:hypothetical protein